MKCPDCIASGKPPTDLGAAARPRVHFTADGKTRTVTQICEGCRNVVTTQERGSHLPDGSWKKA